jgi:aspartyl-tRNA(Asn)/glutamyl-tRNA(Gln) amidotransferase subunit B
MAKWEVVIGLETHAQLSTAAKIFSGASTAFGAAPNTQASAVDIALPGVLPVLNRGAVERAIRFGLAVGATINQRSVFARKNYFYPDLPKGYQISQYEIPVVKGGSIDIVSPTRGPVRISLTRAHLEEDAGKSLHEDFHGMTGIDLNRAGTPLLEIVSEPDLRSAEEAVAYAKTLHGLVQWIGICDGNMQEGSFRCDANVSVRPAGAEKLGTRAEIKNLNSFRFMHEAIEFEVRRQIQLIEDGGTVVQETRLYDPDRGETRSMRSKEDAQDYRYFPDPDLPPLVIDPSWIEDIRVESGDTPEERRNQYVSFGLPDYDARTLTASRDVADYFDELCKLLAQELGDSAIRPEVAKLCANWVTGPVAAALNDAHLDYAQFPVRPKRLAELLKAVSSGELSQGHAKDQVFPALMPPGGRTPTQTPTHPGMGGSGSMSVTQIIQSLGLISDTAAIEMIVNDVIAANAAIVAEYRAGKEKAFNSLVGKAMAASEGKANPAQVNSVLRRKLGA